MGFHLDGTESFAKLTQEAKRCIQYHTPSYACVQPVESLTEKISRDGGLSESLAKVQPQPRGTRSKGGFGDF